MSNLLGIEVDHETPSIYITFLGATTSTALSIRKHGVVSIATEIFSFFNDRYLLPLLLLLSEQLVAVNILPPPAVSLLQDVHINVLSQGSFFDVVSCKDLDLLPCFLTGHLIQPCIDKLGKRSTIDDKKLAEHTRVGLANFGHDILQSSDGKTQKLLIQI